MKNRNLDLFKLLVTILLIFILIILLIQKPAAVISNGMNNAADSEATEGIAVEEKSNSAQFPEYPLIDSYLVLDEKGLGLLDINGELRFKLSEDKQKWEPVIPGEILEKLPNGYALTSDESNAWYIIDGNGNALYSFNLEVLAWNMAPEKITEAQDASGPFDDKEIIVCEGANTSRLTSVGSQVKVVNAFIPLRSSPDTESDNYMIFMPKGTTLEITKLPVCTPFLSGANLWWGVRTESGLEGWAAEASAISDVYYLQEIR